MKEQEGDDDETTWEEAEEVESASVRGITSDQSFCSAQDALKDEKRKGLDIIGLTQRLQLDFYDGVRLVNTARRLAAEGLDSVGISQRLETDASWREDSAALTPVIKDDPLLQSLDDLIQDDTEESDASTTVKELQARLDSIILELRLASHAVRSALQDEIQEEVFLQLNRTADLLPELLTTAKSADDYDEADPRQIAAMKRDIVSARNKLILIAKRAKSLIASSSSSTTTAH